MDDSELILAISDKEVDVEKYTQLIIHADHFREVIMDSMMTDPDIMVYYHCYYIVSRASEEKPELFYRYWHEIASLLGHKNSYHRDFALTILANLTRVDREDLFSQIFQSYFLHINDAKFMTGLCCVRNSLKILQNKPEYKDRIIAILLDVDGLCTYPVKQRELMKSDVLEILDTVYAGESNKIILDEFIRSCVDSISAKTKHKARELAAKYGLNNHPHRKTSG